MTISIRKLVAFQCIWLSLVILVCQTIPKEDLPISDTLGFWVGFISWIIASWLLSWEKKKE